MFKPLILVAVLSVTVGGATHAQSSDSTADGQVLSGMPEKVEPGDRYLIYLHGRIIEDAGPRPTHPRFGIYEYAEILDTLAAAGFTVISEQREPNANVSAFAQRVAGQALSLIESGVSPESITVMGFSKGGGIAIQASSLLNNEQVNFIFLAACGDWVFTPEIQVAGRILSVREDSDELAESCDSLFEEAGIVPARREIVIETGDAHGAFYRPRAEWIEPAIEWALRQQ